MIVTTNDGKEFELTPDEIKFLRAVKRLEKLNQGRIKLFGNGSLNLRISDDGKCFANSDFGTVLNVFCDGGDGGDNE